MANFLDDDFTGPVNTILSAHTPTGAGGAYSLSKYYATNLPTARINLDGANGLQTAVGGTYVNSAVPGSNPQNHSASIRFSAKTFTAGGDWAINPRWNDTDDTTLQFLALEFFTDGSGNPSFRIREQDSTVGGGYENTLFSSALPDSDAGDYTLAYDLHGMEIAGSLSGGSLTDPIDFDETIAHVSGIGYTPLVGLTQGATSAESPTTGVHIQALRVAPYVAPGTTIAASNSTFLSGVFDEEWDKSHAAGSGYVINAGAPGSDIDLNIVVSSTPGPASLNFDTSVQGGAAAGAGSAWNIEVNGVNNGTIHFIGPSDASSLITPTLAANTTNRVRCIQVGNTSSSARWAIGDPQTAKVTGITIPTGATLATSSRASAWWLAITDSIPEGYNDVNTGTTAGTGVTNNYLSYISRVTRAMGKKLVGAMYSGIGMVFPGIGVPYGVLNPGDNTGATDLWDHIFAGLARPFTTAPELIYLAVGTNEWATDVNTVGHTATDSGSTDVGMIANLQTFFARVRAKAGLSATPILVSIPPGGYKRAAILAGIAAYIAAHPSETHIIPFDVAHGSPSITATGPGGVDEIANLGGSTKDFPDNRNTIRSAQSWDRTHWYALATGGSVNSVDMHGRYATILQPRLTTILAGGSAGTSGAFTAGTLSVTGTGGAATLTATRATGGSAPYTYQFEKNAGSGWVSAGSAIGNQAATISAITVDLTGLSSGTQLRCKVTDGSNAAAIVYSNVVTYVLPTVTSITVSPASVNVFGGGARRFSAVVNGTGDISQDVTWATSAGSIDSTGLLTVPAAGANPQTITVTATSVDDNTKHGTATVIVPAGASAAGSVRYMAGMVTVVGQDGVTIAKQTYMLGDAAPDLEVQFKDDAGNPLDLTGYTVEFDMGPPGGSPSQAIIDRAAAAIPYPAKGFVTYSWAPGDLATPGTYRARFYAIAPNGKTISSGVITVIVKDRFSN